LLYFKKVINYILIRPYRTYRMFIKNMNENQKEILKLAQKEDISKLKFREIARKLNIKNPQTVIYHIDQLKKKGLIYFDAKNKQKVAESKAFATDKFFSIPVVGTANCGSATEIAHEHIQGYLKISPKLIKKSRPDGLIAVRAVGKSLNRANIEGRNIEDGDYVIVDCNQEPKNGDYILSIIDDAANFKKFYNNDDEIRLISESTLKIPPMIFHKNEIDEFSYLINGVAIKVIKK